MHYRCQGEHFEKEQFFGKNTCFFWLLLDFQPFFFWKFDKNFPAGVSKLHFAYTGEESEQKIFLEKKQFFIDVRNFRNEKLGVLAKTRLQCCQNCILCVQRNGLKIFSFFETNNIFKRCCTMTGKFFGCLAKKTSAGLPKLHFMCSEEWFEDIYFFWNE